MKEYEVIHEIFNQCPGNKTRDQFIEEIEIEETPEEWVRKKFKNEKELRLGNRRAGGYGGHENRV